MHAIEVFHLQGSLKKLHALLWNNREPKLSGSL